MFAGEEGRASRSGNGGLLAGGLSVARTRGVRFPRFSNGGFGRGPLRQYNAALHPLPPVLYAAHLPSVPDPAQGLLDLVRGGHVPTGFKEDGESKSSSLGTKAMTAARHGLWQSMATTAERHRLWQGMVTTAASKLGHCASPLLSILDLLLIVSFT
uniref:Uncharacterized protein n=2 Tax=Oryza sativa subsp. japonica TaxID=39947 RepID=Q69N51_ORYSJ|nr:hypothetical protein [Oryza sativa Japonica Group]BAD32065.1 hypothetical protein [Oryza sativa Japonica Group]